METVKFRFEDADLSMVIYKALEIFDIIKDVKLKLLGRTIDIDEKKQLAILLATLDTDNRVGNRLNKIGLYYGIVVRSNMLTTQKYNCLYDKYFCEMLQDMKITEETKLEDLLDHIIGCQFIMELNDDRGLSLDNFRDVLDKSRHDSKIKVLVGVKNS